MPRHLTPEQYWQVVNLWNADKTRPYASIGRAINPVAISRHAVSDIIHRYQATGDPVPKRGQLRPRAQSLTEEEVQRLVDYVTANPFATTTSIRRVLGIQASNSTISRRLAAHNLHVFRAAKKPRLTAHHKNERLAFAVKYADLDWTRVMFTDETTVSSAQDNGIIFVRRQQGQRYAQNNVREDRQSGRVSVGFWGGFTHDGLGDIYRIHGRLTAETYKRRILAHHVTPWFTEHPNAILQQDNAPSHKACHVMTYLRSKNIELLSWPPASPDISPIENFWAYLKREIGEVNLPPGSVEVKRTALWNKVCEAWERMKTGDQVDVTRRVIRSYYDGMKGRLTDLNAAGGGPTRH